MKSITIDFTKSPIEISDEVLGHKGEKNATQLIITPPAEMAAPDSGIVYYCVAFQIGAHRVSHSALYEKAETITVPLEWSVTQVNVLSLQLEGYDEEENVIIKSDRIDNLTFGASVDGEEYDNGSSHNLGAEVAEMKTKLNKFGEDENGNLTYKNNPISGERPTESIIFSDGEIIGYPYHEHHLPLLAWEEILPVGTEIKTIKIKYNDSWIDIHELNIIDAIPYVLTMNKVYVDELDSGGYVFALLGRVGVWGAVAEAFSVDNITEVEVIYYTDGGVE